MLEPFADALFPWSCALCGARATAGVACGEHALGGPARYVEDGSPRPRCGRCAVLLPSALPDGSRCRECRVEPPRFHGVVFVADYGHEPAVRAWILALKHGGRADLARPLGEFLAARLRSLAAERPEVQRALVVPVPLHPLRRLARGYDQARLVARSAALGASLAFVDALERGRATSPQGAPGSPSRRANVRGAFRVRAGSFDRGARRMRARLAGRLAILVDDVLTSGSTADECAGALRGAGAREVLVACLARASPRRELGSARAPDDGEEVSAAPT